MTLRIRSSRGRFEQLASDEPNAADAGSAQRLGRRALPAKQSTSPALTSSRVIAVCSPIGSHGRSLVAASLAFCFGQGSSQGEVLLVDADTKAPAQHILHGITELTAGVLAAGRLARLDRYSEQEHERLVVAAKGYGLLTGIQSIERWSELDDHACNRMLATLRLNANTLVVDLAAEMDAEPVEPSLGIRRNQLAITAVQQAAIVILVCQADPIALGRLAEAFKVLESTSFAGELKSMPRVILAINRMRDAAIGPGAKRQIEDYLDGFAATLNFEVVFLPYDPKACDSALQAGEVVARAHPRSPFSRAVRALVAQINSSHVNTSRAR